MIGGNLKQFGHVAALVAMVAVALFAIGCATRYGKNLVQYETSPKQDVVEAYGKPDFETHYEGTTYLAYFLGKLERRCSAIFAMSNEDRVFAIDRVGAACEEGNLKGKATDLLASMDGQSVVNVLKTFGSPNRVETAEADSSLVVLRYVLTEGERVTIDDAFKSGPVSVGVSIGPKIGGCSFTVSLKDGIVVDTAPPKGWICSKWKL